MKPWETIERVATDEGALELRRRGDDDFLITIAGRVLMTSRAHRSEDELAQLACRGLPRAPRVLVGGLGMGYTLRAALDVLPADAAVEVAELNRQVAAWCRGPLAALTRHALDDPRVTLTIGDVADVIARARGLSAIVLDLYEGPHAATQGAADPLYGDRALERTFAALDTEGVFAVWSEEADHAFEARLTAHRLRFTRHKSGGGRTHVIYLVGGGPRYR